MGFDSSSRLGESYRCSYYYCDTISHSAIPGSTRGPTLRRISSALDLNLDIKKAVFC